jgi:uncharacterized phage protein gp47/JayE
MIQRLSLTQPNLDTKPGTVARDLFIDLPADQLSRLYSSLSLVADKQSLATTTGSDLDRLAANFGSTRNTGSAASGIVVFCTNTLSNDIPIPSNTIVTSRNGLQFRTVGNYSMIASDRNRLAANATRMKKSLNIAGINATYAIEIPVQASRPGSAGNIGSLQIVSTELQFPVTVVNLTSMAGGTNRETDDSFRSRILSVFSGANIGTSAGYRNTALGVQGVLDALVVQPGNSLMLRDGTETIATSDGSTRIINSGTGGKVDIYILGRRVQEFSESFIFTDLSGTGNISDERNDFTLGQSNQDPTRTIEERRVLAFSNGTIPAQPVDSFVSVVGSSSGILTEKYTDNNGKIRGNFELSKDLNPESGGSPFGFDKLHFISNTKEVDADVITKISDYSIDELSFTDINNITNVYTDINEVNENSKVSSSGNRYIQLLHKPVVRVSKVQNKTTGETYSVVSQTLDANGLNQSGLIEISGKTLPTIADVLAVNYTWRQIFDPYIDYGSDSLSQFKDESATDSIDWTSSGGIFEEESIITKSADNINYQIELNYNINKVLSAYTKVIVESSVSTVSTIENTSTVGIVLATTDPVINNIISIRRLSDNLELYNSKASDGYFVSRTIYLPSDSPAQLGDSVVINYNKVEVYNINSTDGSYYNQVVVLPSESVLDASLILSDVDDAYLAGDPVYVKYVANLNQIYPQTSLAQLPITGSTTSNSLLSSAGIVSTSNTQPVIFEYANGSPKSIVRFGPSKLRVDVSGVSSAGKIKVSGTTLNRYTVDVVAGTSKNGNIFSIESDLKKSLAISSLPSSVGIAKIDKVSKLDSSGIEIQDFDILGYAILDNTYDIGYSKKDASLKSYQFVLPNTTNNNAISIASGDIIRINLLVYNTNNYEELYYSTSSIKITNNLFARISSISVSSGFRNTTGNIIGNISIFGFNQPLSGQTYNVDYNFLAPKEGERITVTYNINQLIIDTTSEIERVRPITADVLVKEASEILVDVSGTLLINDDSLAEANKIVENVTNSVTNLLNTSKLGPVVDYSDIISVAAAESGVDSVNISLFNENGNVGRKAYIKALDNQTISPGTIIFEAVPRNKFRIN